MRGCRRLNVWWSAIVLLRAQRAWLQRTFSETVEPAVDGYVATVSVARHHRDE
jgi:hypothetical protein